MTSWLGRSGEESQELLVERRGVRDRGRGPRSWRPGVRAGEVGGGIPGAGDPNESLCKAAERG